MYSDFHDYTVFINKMSDSLVGLLDIGIIYRYTVLRYSNRIFETNIVDLNTERNLDEYLHYES